jgi:branched-chain amino acid aminotransferase
MLVNVNGALLPKERALVSVFDHGILYGDGVFEGIRAYGGKVFRLDQHLERLFDSAKAILLKVPVSLPEMRRQVLRTLAANRIRDGYVRLVVTRGPGDLGLGPERCDHPTWFVIADKIKLYPEEHYRQGLKIATVPTRRNSSDTLSPKIKSLNYLNNILAKIEAQQRGCLEAILLNADGYVAECTGDNLFILRRNRLLTPPTYLGALDGVTRLAVLELAAKLRIPAAEEPFTRYDVYTAQEAFLTGTAAELVPVVEVDGRPVGSGKPGPLTARLRSAYQTLTRKEGTRIPSSL